MPIDTPGSAWLCLLTLLAGSAVQPATPAVPQSTGDATTALQSTQPTTNYTVSVERHGPDETTFLLRAAFRDLNPSARYVVTIRGWIRNGTEVRETEALERRTTDAGERVWTVRGNATEASMTVEITTNATVDVAGRPRITVDALDVVGLYQSDGTELRDRTVRARGTAVRVEDFLYFGEATVTRVVLNDRSTPVVTPAGVDAQTTPGQVATAVNRTAEFHGFPAPPETLSIWYDPHIPGSEGSLAGSAGYDTINLTPDASNATVRHEYVHVRQRFGGTTETTWFLEGSAEYLAHLPTLRRNDTGLRGYYDRVAVETRDVSHNLPAGRDEADVYGTGEMVVAALDFRLRAATNGTGSVVDVIRYLNRHSTDGATLTALYEAVGAVGGDSHAAWLREAMETRTLPVTPNESTARTALVQSYPNTSFDGDRLSNGYELSHSSDPFVQNSDEDSLPDGVEVSEGLDPNARDTDGDGTADGTDPKPHVASTEDVVRVAGGLLMALSLMSLWLTAGVAVARGVDRVVGIIPSFIASRSLKRLGLVQATGFLLGMAVWMVGWLL